MASALEAGGAQVSSDCTVGITMESWVSSAEKSGCKQVLNGGFPDEWSSWCHGVGRRDVIKGFL